MMKIYFKPVCNAHTRAPSILANVIATSLLMSAGTQAGAAGYSIKEANLSNVDTTRWQCKFCPDASTKQKIEVGLGFADDADSQRFRDKTRSEDGKTAFFGMENSHQGEAVRSDVFINQLGTDEAKATVSLKTKDQMTIEAGYQSTSQYTDNHSQSIFSANDGGNLTLPDSWSREASSADMDFSELRPVSTFSERDTSEARVSKQFGRDGAKVYGHYRRQNHQGTKWRSSQILNNIVALDSPIDEQTRELTLGASYPFAIGSGQLSVGIEYFNAQYENAYQQFSWENPYGGDGILPERSALAATPDNEYQQWRVFSSYYQGQHQMHLSLAKGEGEQDEQFLDYTDNPALTSLALPQSALPESSYQGEVDTTHARIGWNFQTHGQWRFALRGYYDDRENNSEINVYQPVFSDLYQMGEVSNQLLSHEKSGLEGKAHWQVRPTTRFSYVYGYEHYERQEDGTSEADTQDLSFAWKERWSNKLSSHLKILAEERDQDDSLSDFSLAERLRNSATLDLNWQCLDRLNMTARYQLTLDDYEENTVGVTEVEDKNAGAGLNWQLSEHIDTHVHWQRSWRTWEMNGSSNASIPTWRSEQKDRYDTYIVGISHGALLDSKLALGLDYIMSDAAADTVVNETSYTPRATSKAHHVLGYAQYQWRPSWQVRIEAVYENYRDKDWQTVAVNDLSRLISNDADNEAYNEWWGGVKLIYQPK